MDTNKKRQKKLKKQNDVHLVNPTDTGAKPDINEVINDIDKVVTDENLNVDYKKLYNDLVKNHSELRNANDKLRKEHDYLQERHLTYKENAKDVETESNKIMTNQKHEIKRLSDTYETTLAELKKERNLSSDRGNELYEIRKKYEHIPRWIRWIFNRI